MLFFNTHISRTGGLTVAHLFKRNFGDQHLDLYTQEIREVLGRARVKPTIGMLTLDELDRILDQYGNDRVRSISSHWIPIPEGLEVLKERFGRVMMITFLRNPIEVIISKFFHFRQRYLKSEILPEHMKYDYRNDLNLFLKHWEYVSQQYEVQDQCRDYTAYFFDNDRNADTCLSRLREEFWFVGLTERFNEGLVMLKQKFQDLSISFNICYHKKNKGPKAKKERKELVTQKILENIRDQNIIDLQLYEDSLSIYEKNIQEYSGDIKKDLFRYQQKLFIWRLYHSIFGNL